MYGSVSPGGKRSGSGIRIDKKQPPHPKEKGRAKMAEEENWVPSLVQQVPWVLKEGSGTGPPQCLTSWKRRSRDVDKPGRDPR